VLLIATMLRLALNLASTRLILAHGHEGTSAAGHVIEAFGNFVMAGNFVIGIIVFTILVIVNFVVITKAPGASPRSRRASNLDAMPGKQMAIDADLSAGLIARRTRAGAASSSRTKARSTAPWTALEIRARRRHPGLLVVFINIIGGMIVGHRAAGIARKLPQQHLSAASPRPALDTAGRRRSTDEAPALVTRRRRRSAPCSCAEPRQS